MSTSEKIRPEEVYAQLTEILESSDFQASPRLRDFLTFVVQRTLDAKGQDLKAYTIGLEVFGLGEEFDPNANPLVRTEAGRLRNKLEHFYLHNPKARINIKIPKGGYAAAFSRIVSPESNNHPNNQLFSFSPQKVPQAEHKTSIMLMPFINVNKAVEAEAIVKGLSNCISIHLTKFYDLKVVNYDQVLQLNAVFKQILEKDLNLDARFILCGSVQLEKNIIEVYASLVDTTSMYNIWAEKFDAEIDSGSLLEVQESIAQSIVSRIADDFGLINRTLLKEMTSGAHATSSIQEASLLYYHWTAVLNKEDFIKALASVEKAHAGSPNNIPILAMLADLYASGHQWSYGLVENALEKSLQMATAAVNQDPSCQLAYMALALNYFLRTDFNKFQHCAERAIELNPSSTNALSAVGSWYALSGEWERAFELTERIMLLSMNCPDWCHFAHAMQKYLEDDYEGSLTEAQKINMPHNLWGSLIHLAAGAFLHNEEECIKALCRLEKIYPDFRNKGDIIIKNNLPYEEFSSKVLQGLAKAGIKFD